VALPAILRSLLTAAGPSGYEHAPAAVFADAAREYTDDVTIDVMGSVVARVPGTIPGTPSLAVVGHIDEIGLVVTHVEDGGLLRFTQVGGWDPQILSGQRVEIHTRGGVVPGVIGRKAIHLLREEDRRKVPELRELHIDIGAHDGERARALVRNGDVAVIAGEPVELEGGRAASRAMDNRLGSYIALEVGRAVAAAGGPPGDVLACAVVQEEIGLNGARTTAHRVRPDVAIAVDVTHETSAPGVDAADEGVHRFGDGPVIERGPTLHPAVFELLHDTAEAHEIGFTISASGRSTGTDADAFHLSRSGIPTGLVSIALRYMHSPVEVVQLDDIDACVRLITAFALALTPQTTFAR
jgi:endoglucanase